MGNLANMTSVDQVRTLDEALDSYFTRLSSVACVTIVDELMRSLAEFYDLAAASDRLADFRSTCQGHGLHELLLEDPFTAHGFFKPGAQAADATMLDYIYRPRYLGLSEIGEAVHFVTTNLGAARSIVRRRDRFAKAIARTVRGQRRARILSLDNGHLRELDIVRRLVDRQDFQILALDTDGAALRESINANPDFNIVPLQQPVWHFLRQIDETQDNGCEDNGCEDNVGFDLIYAASPFDQLDDAEAADLLGRLASKLAPAGRLIVGSYAPGNSARGYMEGMMGWSVNFRGESDLERLAVSSKLTRFRSYQDGPGNIVYLEVASART